MTLSEQLAHECLSSYARLRGGYPIPMAGTVYWAVLAALGLLLAPAQWSPLAFALTGAIFPLALLFAKLTRNAFLKDRTAVTGVLVPAFVSMLLFWPIAVAALWEAETLTPLVLAIGLSIHWPVIGWSYGRPGLFIAHAVIRAIGAFLIWHLAPEHRFTLLPAWVALVYAATVAALFIDSAAVKKRLSVD